MRRLTLRALVALLTFVVGVAAATLWSMHYFGLSDQPHAPADAKPGDGGGAAPAQWQKIDLDGKASFLIPLSLKPTVLYTSRPYSAFRRDGMDFTMLYRRAGTSAACIHHKEEKFSKSKVSAITVADKPATIRNEESAVFGPEDLNAIGPLKGVTICVPHVGDSEHEVAIVARYRDEQDYQDLRQVIDSIEFR